jgi:hypothetical protein
MYGAISVNTVTSGILEFHFRQKQRISTVSRPALGPTKPPSQPVARLIFLWIKRPVLKPDYIHLVSNLIIPLRGGTYLSTGNFNFPVI